MDNLPPYIQQTDVPEEAPEVQHLITDLRGKK